MKTISLVFGAIIFTFFSLVLMFSLVSKAFAAGLDDGCEFGLKAVVFVDDSNRAECRPPANTEPTVPDNAIDTSGCAIDYGAAQASDGSLVEIAFQECI